MSWCRVCGDRSPFGGFQGVCGQLRASPCNLACPLAHLPRRAAWDCGRRSLLSPCCPIDLSAGIPP
eukprot:8941489-Pyramimonas_sp.AAC.1